VLVCSFRLVQSHTLNFNPSVCFELFRSFADPDAKSGGKALSLEEVPQNQGFDEACRVNDSVANSGSHHSAGIVYRVGHLLLGHFLEETRIHSALQGLSGFLESSPAQRQGDHRKQDNGAYQQSPGFRIQRPKSLE
jgi:hypothetical protein